MRILKSEARARMNVKRSVFVASVAPASNVKEAKEFISKVSEEFRDATHNCWAYRVFENGKVIEHFSDAGEPSGSAGPPILRVLKALDLVNVVAVVTRYFGGVKLGIRGLIEAYSEATRHVLKDVRILKVELRKRFEVEFHVSEYGKYASVLSKNSKILQERFEGERVKIKYAAAEALVPGSRENGCVLVEVRDQR